MEKNIGSSSFRACGITGRVMIVHDMPERTVFSELEREAADMLIRQLQEAMQDGFGPTPHGIAALPGLRE